MTILAIMINKNLFYLIYIMSNRIFFTSPLKPNQNIVDIYVSNIICHNTTINI